MRAADLAPFAASLGVPALFHFPQASLPAHDGGFSWWPVNAPRAGVARVPRDLAQAYPAGRADARAALARFLEALEPQRAGRPLLLAGFSQGGMLACDCLLHEAVKIDALALLSASRIAFDDWLPRLSRLQGLPALVSHGRDDPDLAFAAGEALRDALAAGGARVDWLPFDGGHEMPLPVWRGLRKLIREIAPPRA
jgi:phospholipase/carboxylesterase